MDRFRSWTALQGDPDLEDGALSLVLYLAEKLYSDYEPSGFRPFMHRLESWLGNVTSESDQKILISLLSHLFFAGRNEFESLYRSTLTNIYRWLVEISASNLDSNDLDNTLADQLSKTWICPITDSLRINSFLKINGLKGHDHRPHWRSLAKFGDVARISDYMKTAGIENLVLLEDFVGSGTQIDSTIRFVANNFGHINTLLCPLIICPKGHSHLSHLAERATRVSYSPTLVLPEDAFLSPLSRPIENATFKKARALILRLGQRVTQPFGFRDTGAMVVMFSNCPDNTLALFREENPRWAPLFPRVWRPE